jgi:hypothetical protein
LYSGFGIEILKLLLFIELSKILSKYIEDNSNNISVNKNGELFIYVERRKGTINCGAGLEFVVFNILIGIRIDTRLCVYKIHPHLFPSSSAEA